MALDLAGSDVPKRTLQVWFADVGIEIFTVHQRVLKVPGGADPQV